MTLPDLNGYFDQALAAYHAAAAEAGDGPARDYRLAGASVRVCFASQALAAGLVPAIAHLAQPPAAPDLTIYAWGGEAPGRQPAPPPWPRLAYYERGNVRGFQGPHHSLLYDRRVEVFSAVDHRRALGLYWSRDETGLNYRERATPLRRLLQLWLEGRGMLVLHAAAAGHNTGGALLAGRNGSGKSTTALACLRAGLSYAGDDYVAAALEPDPYVHGLYSSAKLNAQALGWLPELAPLVSNPEDLGHEKALVYLANGGGQHLSAGFPPRAIVLPRVAAANGTAQGAARAISPEVAYRTLLPDTLLGMLGDARAAPGRLARLVRSAPCYQLDLTGDVNQAADAVARLLQENDG